MTANRWSPTAQKARELVLEHGWNATAYQIVNPGMDHWFAAAGDAVVGYVLSSGVRVVAGAPVAAAERLQEVAAEFESEARRAGHAVCYFAAEQRLETVYRDSARHSRALLGAQPVWQPSGWSRAVRGHRSVRAQCNRARNKRVSISEWPSDQAANDRGLQRVLDRWLATRSLPTMHFLVEPRTLARLEDRRIFVATRAGPSGDTAEPPPAVVGYVVASPIPRRRGWLIEQFVRDPSAPNGTMEYLLDRTVAALSLGDADYVTLGLAPLAQRRGTLTANEPFWLRVTLGWMRAHGRRFFDFDGLETFKAKFHPMGWEPIFAITNSPRFSPRVLHAIAGAFGARSPSAFMARALLRAAAQEIRWVVHGREAH